MLLLSWTAVTEDCLGMPETVNHYEVHFMYRVCRDWDMDWPPPCDTFTLVTDEPTTEFRTLGNDPPQVGSAWWYDIETVDGAGNRSDGPCQQ